MNTNWNHSKLPHVSGSIAPRQIRIAKRKRLSQGFTLLELMVAIAIFAILSALAYGGLNSVLNTKQETQQHAEHLKKLQLALFFIERDLQQIVARPRHTAYGEYEAALQAGDFDALISFTRAGNPNPAEQLRSHLQRVNYVLEENTLYRLSWNFVDHPDHHLPLRVELLNDVSNISFRFLDKNNEWKENWSQNKQNETLAVLPNAIEVILEHERWGNIRRLLLLPE